MSTYLKKNQKFRKAKIKEKEVWYELKSFKIEAVDTLVSLNAQTRNMEYTIQWFLNHNAILDVLTKLHWTVICFNFSFLSMSILLRTLSRGEQVVPFSSFLFNFNYVFTCESQ